MTNHKPKIYFSFRKIIFCCSILITAFLFSCKNTNNQNNNSKNTNNKASEKVDSIKNISIATVVPDSLSPFEQYLEQHDFVNIQKLDSSIKIDIKYSTTDNFLKTDIYGDFDKCYLSREVAEMLVDAQKYLKDTMPGYGLIVYDGLRPLSVQQEMWDLINVPEKDKPKYLSNPKYGSVHNFGAAVDLSILDKNGNLLDMGTPYDSFDELAYPINEKMFLSQGKLTQKQVDNRKLLRRIMQKAGFFNIQTEWWHFNSCYRKEAREKYALVTSFDAKPEKEQLAVAENIVKESTSVVISFKVQVLATKQKLNETDPRFKGLEIHRYFHKGLYKYVSGEFNNVNDAFAYRDKVLSSGIPEAFVAAFKNGERIEMKEAVELIN